VVSQDPGILGDVFRLPSSESVLSIRRMASRGRVMAVSTIRRTRARCPPAIPQNMSRVLRLMTPPQSATTIESARTFMTWLECSYDRLPCNATACP
jgi:hypothetical protein